MLRSAHCMSMCVTMLVPVGRSVQWLEADILTLPSTHPELCGQFDLLVDVQVGNCSSTP